MGNTNAPNGFHIKNSKNRDANRYLAYPGLATKDGDLVGLNSQGYVVALSSAYTTIIGAQNGPIYTEGTGVVDTTASLGDVVQVWDDPDEIFIAQESTFTQSDPYTTAVSASCFDVAGSAGVQYINSAASLNDTIKVVRLSTEFDTGKLSIAGAYAKVECQINPAFHFRTRLI